jgi:hypothetical protein
MEKLQIQPGNLCQFLPQDVVRDFPQMTHQEIFYNTVKVPVHIVNCLLECSLITFSLAAGTGVRLGKHCPYYYIQNDHQVFCLYKRLS